MDLTNQLASHMRAVYFGGNWTAVSLKDKLSDVTWQQATQQVGAFHSIATLVYHMNYFVGAVLKVLRGGPLDAKDKYSFDLPLIESQEDWERLLNQTWTDAEQLASLIEQMPEGQLWQDFSENKYGNYFRNLQGIIEHNHYHLGQIALMKSMLAQENDA